MDRNCNKCIHHTSGSCSVWECTGTVTVDDVKADAIEEVKQTLLESMPLVNNHDLITGFCCAIERVEQMQKGADND